MNPSPWLLDSLLRFYYVNVANSILLSRQVVPHSVFYVNFCKQAFLLLEEKRQKFSLLVQSILASDFIDIKTPQYLSGKCIYFSPGCLGRLSVLHKIYHAINTAIWTSRSMRISAPVKKEIQPTGHFWKSGAASFFGARSFISRSSFMCRDASSFALGLLLFMTIGLLLSATLISMQRKSSLSQMFFILSRKPFQTLGLMS